jgi:hypothetical protein
MFGGEEFHLFEGISSRDIM